MGWVAIQEQEAGPQGSAVRESTSRSILLDPLYCFGFGKESLSYFLLLFRVYEKDVIFSSFYSLYLEYEHRVIQTL